MLLKGSPEHARVSCDPTSIHRQEVNADEKGGLGPQPAGQDGTGLALGGGLGTFAIAHAATSPSPSAAPSASRGSSAAPTHSCPNT